MPNQQPLFGRESLFRQKLNQLRNTSSGSQNTLNDAEARRKQLENSTYLQQLQQNMEKRDPSEVERVAMLDSQTQLYNQSYLLRILKEELKKAKRYKNELSIVMISIDELQRVYQESGEIGYDSVIAGVANYLMRTVRDVDIPARYDRETFCVVCPQTDLEGAITLAERLRTRMPLDRIAAAARNWTLTLSLGVAAFPINGALDSDMVNSALHALLEAKTVGNSYQVGQPVKM